LGFEPEGWVGGDAWCPLRVGNYSKPRVLKEERSDEGSISPWARINQKIAKTAVFCYH